jgi:anaphase-promoting complex subunit 3
VYVLCIDGFTRLLQDIGRAYAALSQYDCAQAVELFAQLPLQHYNTGWVLTQVGRAFFEMADYPKVSLN